MIRKISNYPTLYLTHSETYAGRVAIFNFAIVFNQYLNSSRSAIALGSGASKASYSVLLCCFVLWTFENYKTVDSALPEHKERFSDIPEMSGKHLL